MEKPTTGYIHGSDMILGFFLGDEFTPFGHSKTCSIKSKAETKDRATKETSLGGKLWKEKSISGLSVSISAEGFSFYGDTMGYEQLLELWQLGEPLPVRYAHRGEEKTKYREGLFVITDLDETAPADDDATYSISLENSGPVITKAGATQASLQGGEGNPVGDLNSAPVAAKTSIKTKTEA